MPLIRASRDTMDFRVLNRVANFPFVSRLHFGPLIEAWISRNAQGHPFLQGVAETLRKTVESSPELLRPLDDTAALAEHRDFLSLLTLALFPLEAPDQKETEYVSVTPPFHFFSPVIWSNACTGMFYDEQGNFLGRPVIDEKSLERQRLLLTYAFILEHAHGIDVRPTPRPAVFEIVDPTTGFVKYFQVNLDQRYCRVVRKIGTESLPPEKLALLKGDLNDLDLWQKILRPDDYEIHGFTCMRAADVTNQHAIATLNRILIERDAITSTTKLKDIARCVSTLLQREGLEVGVTASRGDDLIRLSSDADVADLCFLKESLRHPTSHMKGTLFEKAVRNREILLLTPEGNKSACSPENGGYAFLSCGETLIVPLFEGERHLGFLDIHAAKSQNLNAVSHLKIHEMAPMFTTAVKRSLDDFLAVIEGVIKANCTAIHPSVEWKFQAEALESIKRKAGKATAANLALASFPEMGRISFKNVYPLYGVSDIRGSSSVRNHSIQSDLLAQLRLASEALRQCDALRPMFVHHDLLFRIERHEARIQAGLSAGDEHVVLSFLRSEVEPFLAHCAKLDPESARATERYFSSLDGELGLLYATRRRFEESVTLISERIGAYLDREQVTAQKIFPHYFQKHSSDGVDHSLYIGESLVEDREFHPSYLHNQVGS